VNLIALLEELRERRHRLDEAILAMERLVKLGNLGKAERGRPPVWLARAMAAMPASYQVDKKKKMKVRSASAG
jgi:hypothetical protein